MASVQRHKPCERTKQTTCHEKTTKVEACHNNQHSFTDKVKEMTNKILDHHPAPNTNNSSTVSVKVHHEKKHHKVKKTEEGHEGHCMPKMFDHHMMIKKKKKQQHDCSCSDSGSSSEDETCKNKC